MFDQLQGAIYLGVRGTVTLRMECGNEIAIPNLVPGIWHHIYFTGVLNASWGCRNSVFVGCCI